MAKKEKKIQGMTYSQWQDLICLIHKEQCKIRKSNGIMDKIIKKTVIWSDLNEMEEKVRTVCFKFH